MSIDISAFWELRSPWSNSSASPICTKNKFKSKKVDFCELLLNKKNKKKEKTKKKRLSELIIDGCPKTIETSITQQRSKFYRSEVYS